MLTIQEEVLKKKLNLVGGHVNELRSMYNRGWFKNRVGCGGCGMGAAGGMAGGGGMGAGRLVPRGAALGRVAQRLQAPAPSGGPRPGPGTPGRGGGLIRFESMLMVASNSPPAQVCT